MWTYGIVESRLVFETINRIAPGSAFVAILIRLRYDRSGLLGRAANEGVEVRYRKVGNVHVVCRVFPDVPVVEWLSEREQDGVTAVASTHGPLR